MQVPHTWEVLHKVLLLVSHMEPLFCTVLLLELQGNKEPLMNKELLWSMELQRSMELLKSMELQRSMRVRENMELQ